MLEVVELYSRKANRHTHTVTVTVNVTVAVADTVTVKVTVCCIGMAYWHAVFDMLFRHFFFLSRTATTNDCR